MINVQRFTLDIIKPVLNRLKVVNGDTANQFIITIKNDGAAVTLDTDLHKIIAVFKRADGQIYTQDASCGVSFTTGGVVTIDVRPASFRTGTNKITLQIYKRENSSATEYPLFLTTQEQTFPARAAAIPDSSAPNAPSQLPMLEQIIHDAGEAVTACAAATLAANNAATEANTKAGLAEAAATNANTKAGLADAAATSANSAATAANNAATAATNAKNAAVSATSAAESAAAAADTAARAADEAAAEAGSRAGQCVEAISDAETAANAAQDAAYAANQAATAATAAMPVVINVRDITWNEDYTAGSGYADVDKDAIMTAVGNGAIVMMAVPYNNIRMYYSLKDGGDIEFSSARLIPPSTIRFWLASLYKVPPETACRVSIRMRAVSAT